ncbi:MAG: hypothetical protein AB7V39_27165 [Nitrospiraceae bacterium]
MLTREAEAPRVAQGNHVSARQADETVLLGYKITSAMHRGGMTWAA